MSEFRGSFLESIVRTKHAEMTHCYLWGQSTILKPVWDVTCWIRVQSISKRRLNC